MLSTIMYPCSRLLNTTPTRGNTSSFPCCRWLAHDNIKLEAAKHLLNAQSLSSYYSSLWLQIVCQYDSHKAKQSSHKNLLKVKHRLGCQLGTCGLFKGSLKLPFNESLGYLLT